jgi:hypothetical protein
LNLINYRCCFHTQTSSGTIAALAEGSSAPAFCAFARSS